MNVIAVLFLLIRGTQERLAEDILQNDWSIHHLLSSYESHQNPIDPDEFAQSLDTPYSYPCCCLTFVFFMNVLLIFNAAVSKPNHAIHNTLKMRHLNCSQCISLPCYVFTMALCVCATFNKSDIEVKWSTCWKTKNKGMGWQRGKKIKTRQRDNTGRILDS